MSTETYVSSTQLPILTGLCDYIKSQVLEELIDIQAASSTVFIRRFLSQFFDELGHLLLDDRGDFFHVHRRKNGTQHGPNPLPLLALSGVKGEGITRGSCALPSQVVEYAN